MKTSSREIAIREPWCQLPKMLASACIQRGSCCQATTAVTVHTPDVQRPWHSASIVLIRSPI
jgi:hypothetical protein